MTELMIPAGSPEALKAAVIFGADAVYIGGGSFSLRAKAKNFSLSEMEEGIAFAHAHGVKVYVTANIFAHNEDLSGIRNYFQKLKYLRPDALIIADPGVFRMAERICPDIPVHISTQANNTNYETCRFWYEQGAKRIVAARELSLSEIRDLRAQMPSDMELECFVHGAMCISYSGRCLLSSYFAGRDANRGECTHPCRWNYAVMEETRPGEYLPVEENERGTFLFNSRDLCMIEHIPDLIEAGIDSFKVEGRMRTALYVATVARTYREAIDDYLQDPALYEAHIDRYRRQINACTHRAFSTGFFYGKPDQEGQIYDSSTYVTEYTYLGMIGAGGEEGNGYPVEQRNKFSVGEQIEIMKPDGKDLPANVVSIRDEEGRKMESAPHARQKLTVILDAPAQEYDLLRRAEPSAKIKA